MTRVYLYALLSGPPACEAGVGVCAEPLRLVAVAGLVALVGDVAEPPTPSALTLRAQDTVLRRLAAGIDAILPVRFGTLVANDAALAEALAPRRPQLARALGRVAGCEQMTLRVWGEAAPAVSFESAGGGPGTRYLDARRRAHERARSVPELDPLRRRLGGLVREERAERHDRPPLLATVQHLVERGACGRYVEEVDSARAALAPWRVSVSGPWLPYAFGEEAA
ncbi:MAG TPA: GvpL/GvpF family gas vesicle protein [Methylomirabilota bacterium]|nr:GvpL/GvpF family gas vesicle protein [Methylomirabilota bacterium]